MESSKQKRRTSLATKVTAIVLIIILINTVAVGVFSFIIHRGDSVKDSQKKAMAIAKSTAMSIDPVEFKNALETGEKSAHYEHLQKQFDRVNVEEHLSYYYAGTFDPDTPDPDNKGMVMYIQAHPADKIFNLKDDVTLKMFKAPAFDAFKDGTAHVTDIYSFNVDGTPGIAAYAPIFDENQKPVGLVGVLVSVEDVLERSTDFAITMLIISLLIFAVIMWIPIFYLRRSVAKPLLSLQTASNKITNGEMDINMPVRNSNDEVGLLSQNFATMQEIVIGIQSDVKNIVENALNGNLSYRVKSEKYPGEWRKVITKFNELMDTIALPIDEVSDALSKIANGDFQARITSEYKGDFDRMKKSVNTTAVDLDKYLTEKEKAEKDAHTAELAKGRAEAVSEAMLSSARYANKIQQNLLPKSDVFNNAFSDHSIIWKPRDIVGGDIYWAKNFDEGTVLCVCDCTGHGTPGALLTMLVASTFETIISENNYTETAQILYLLDQRLATVLNAKDDEFLSMEIHDGCDLAVLYVAKDGSVSMSAGNLNVFTCDGDAFTRYKGQSLFIGEGKLSSKDEVEVVNISPNPDMKFYIASDGLFDQIGGEHKQQFGIKALKQIALDNHKEKQEVISGKIWDAFEEYRGEEPRRDDFELITFKP